MIARLLTIALLTGIAAAAAVPADAQGSAPAPTPGLQISVEPLSVEFALAPGAQADTPVTIRNVGTQSAVIVITPLDWRSSLDGTVKTERPGAEGPASLSQYLQISGAEATLAPGETKHFTLALALPATFSAVPRDLRGGYLVRAVPANANRTTAFGVGANILVYEMVGAPDRRLKLTDLHVVDDGNHSARLVARLQNEGRTFIRPQLHILLAQAGRVVISKDDTTPAVLGGEPRRLERSFGQLPSGVYQLQLTVDYGGATLVRGTTEFTVR